MSKRVFPLKAMPSLMLFSTRYSSFHSGHFASQTEPSPPSISQSSSAMWGAKGEIRMTSVRITSVFLHFSCDSSFTQIIKAAIEVL